MKFGIVAILISSVVFFSCKKNTVTVATKTELITKGAWKYDDAGADLDKNGTIELSISAQLKPCMMDNTISFSANGTGTVDEGALKCDAASPQTLPVTWSFSNNENSLNLGGAGVLGIGGQFKIVTLTETQLSLSKDTTYQGAPVAFVVQLKH